MKVSFFTQGVRTPSSRFRVQQLLPALSDHGIDAAVHAPTPSAQGQLQGLEVPPLLRHVLRPFSVPHRLAQLRHIFAADVVVVQKPLFNYPFLTWEPFVAKRRPTVFDIDDALFHGMGGRFANRFRRIAAACDAVVAGNTYLAEWFASPDKTYVIPTVVDIDRYHVRPDPGTGTFTLGWTGSAANAKELEPWVPALREVFREVGGRLIVMAERPCAPVCKDLPVTFVRWSRDVEVEMLDQVHVGLMPLADVPYNRGKCGFKLLQYQARGIPVVASAVGANQSVMVNGQSGYLVRGHRDVVDALVTLARAADFRVAMGREGRRHVATRYAVPNAIQGWMRVFETLAPTRQVAPASDPATRWL